MAQIHHTHKAEMPTILRTHHTKEELTFDPYKLLSASLKNPMWQTTPHLAENWVTFQQKLWQGYIEWLSWQQHTIQENFQDSLRVATHCFELSSHPNTFYRYMRFNWQKPYLNLNAQALSSTRLMTRLMVDSWCAWQKLLLKSESSDKDSRSI